MLRNLLLRGNGIALTVDLVEGKPEDGWRTWRPVGYRVNGIKVPRMVASLLRRLLFGGKR